MCGGDRKRHSPVQKQTIDLDRYLRQWMAPERASVAELVDATDSKSVSGDGVPVRVRPEVPFDLFHTVR